MAVLAKSLLNPYGGELDPNLFEDGEVALLHRVEAWIAAAETKGAAIADAAAKDAFVLEWAYYLAYQAGIVYRATRESSASLATGESRSFDASQIAALEEARDRHKADAEALLPGATPGVAPRASQARRHGIRY